MIVVQRYDNNPANYATFGKWVHVCSFPNLESAQAYIDRAAGPTQQLRIEPKEPRS